MTNTSDSTVLPINDADSGCTQDEENNLHPIDSVQDSADKNIWHQSNITDYQQLVSAFKTAEGDIKDAEIVDKAKNGLLVPAVNELRYCSYHIIKAINADNEADQKEQLHRAARHCERASYDALELGLSTLIIKIEEFKKIYIPKNVVLASVIDGYADDMAEVRHAQDLLTDNYKDKAENFQKIRKQLLKLKKIYIKLQEAEPDIRTSAQQNNRTLTLTRTSLIITLLIALAGWYKVFSSEKQLSQMQNQLNDLQRSLTPLSTATSSSKSEVKPTPNKAKD